MEKLTDVEIARIKKTHGCSPRLYLQCKGPKETEWSNISSLGYDTIEGKTVAHANLIKSRDRWEAQGMFPDHTFRIISLADLIT